MVAENLTLLAEGPMRVDGASSEQRPHADRHVVRLRVIHERPPCLIERAIGVAETLERGGDDGAGAHRE